MLFFPPKCVESPYYSMVEISLRNDSHVTTSLWNTSLGEYVPIIKLRMFGGYISVTEASIEAKIQVISICTLFFDLSD